VLASYTCKCYGMHCLGSTSRMLQNSSSLCVVCIGMVCCRVRELSVMC
jgi:hypothetical protein